jgi:hypothetical protein
MARVQGRQEILGYQMTMPRGLWERIKTLGVPRYPGSIWLAVNVLTAFLLMVLVAFKWILLPIGLWVLGHGVMLCLTARDEHWDEVILAQLIYHYKDRYEAG